MTFSAVLFDCDGVLVDSEPITVRVLRDMLQEEGWVMTYEQCYDWFIGKALPDELPTVSKMTGKDLDMEWVMAFRMRRNHALTNEVMAIPGIQDTLDAILRDKPGMIACASGADRAKLVLQLGQTGLLDYFGTHIYSGAETPRNKPYPDVYLAAAQGLGVDPQQCLVVEDSVTGASAGLAAGATVLGYCPVPDKEEELRRLGVRDTFRRMDELPALIAKLEQERVQS